MVCLLCVSCVEACRTVCRQAIAMELAYGEYNNLSVDDRVRLLAALAELAVNSELLRDVVEGEWKSRAPGAGPSLVRGHVVQPLTVCACTSVVVHHTCTTSTPHIHHEYTTSTPLRNEAAKT